VQWLERLDADFVASPFHWDVKVLAVDDSLQIKAKFLLVIWVGAKSVTGVAGEQTIKE
jgi:hypothetical protein